MIPLASSILTIYIWGIVCILIYVLYTIARFFEQKSGRRSYYFVFIIPIILFAAAGLSYAWAGGNFLADVLSFIGAVVLTIAGYFLLNLMIGGRS